MRKRTCISLEFSVLYDIHCCFPNNLDFEFFKEEDSGILFDKIF